ENLFFFSSRRRHTRLQGDWSSDVCSSDLQHKVSKKLVERYQVIVFEDIKTSNLTRKPKPKPDANGTYLPNGAAAQGGLNKSILRSEERRVGKERSSNWLRSH